MYFPKNEEEVKEVLALNPIILGCGSNVLIDDRKEYEHAMILTKFNQITLDGNVTTTGTSNLQGATTIQGKDFLSHAHSNGNQGKDTGGVI